MYITSNFGMIIKNIFDKKEKKEVYKNYYTKYFLTYNLC